MPWAWPSAYSTAERYIAERSLAIELADELSRLVLVRGRAAARGQRIGSDRQETGERHAPRDILDMRVEPAVLVDDDDGRPLRVARFRPRHVGIDGAARRIEALPARFQRGIVDGDCRRNRIAVLEERQQEARRGGAAGEPCQAREELAARHGAVGVFVVKIDGLSEGTLPFSDATTHVWHSVDG